MRQAAWVDGVWRQRSSAAVGMTALRLAALQFAVLGMTAIGSLTSSGCSNSKPPNPPAAAAPAQLPEISYGAPATPAEPAAATPPAATPAVDPRSLPAASAAAPPAVAEKTPPEESLTLAPPANAAPQPSPAAAAAPPAAVTTDHFAATLPDLQKRLAASDDEDARVETIDEIAALGQNARGAFDDLLKYTFDDNIRVRWHAARALGRIGEDALAALPRLVDMLSDADPIVATQAAAAIRSVRNDDGRATAELPAADAAAYGAATKGLVATTVHPDPRVRRASLLALNALRPAPEVLVPLFNERLSDSDPSVILPAINSLAEIGAPAVPFLTESLKNPKARYWASLALAEIGPAAAPAVGLLKEAAQQGAIEERMQAILALGAIGAPAAEAAEVLIKNLSDPEGAVRFASAYSLGQMRAVAADAALEQAAADPDGFLAAIASWARARIHPDNKDLVVAAFKTLSAGLSSDRANTRSGAVSALTDLLGSLDDTEEQALAEKFVTMLEDPVPGVRGSAATGLARLGGNGVAALERALANPALRPVATQLLASAGAASKPAVDGLIVSLGEGTIEARGDAAVALAAIGPDAAEAVPALQKILTAPTVGEDDSASLRYTSAFALGRIGTAAAPAVEALQALSTSDDPLMATVAVWALLKIEPTKAERFETAVPLLRKALRGDAELVRLEAAVALGDIGPKAASAIPILELVAEDDPVDGVRKAAQAALGRIKGSPSTP